MTGDITINDVLKLQHSYKEIAKKHQAIADILEKVYMDWQDDFIIGAVLRGQIDVEKAMVASYTKMAETLLLKLT
jgi:hypothetical protein